MPRNRARVPSWHWPNDQELDGDLRPPRTWRRSWRRKPSLTLLLRSIEMNARMPESQSMNFLDSLRPHSSPA